jgi:uncharacterized protein (TIGR02145 family)
LVTAVADGMVTARATANDGSGVYGTLIITISGQIVKVTSITVTGEGGVNTIATLGGILQLYAILLPDNANNKSVTWSVTNSTGQATINSTGLVTAVAYGTVTARATANDGSGIFGSLAITILEPSGTIHDTRDNHDYKWVRIGNQVWMAENLAYVPAVSPPTVGSDTESYYYVYDYYGSSVSEAKATYNYAVYGILYNWTAAVNGATSSNTNPSGVQGACPSGWHLPSDAEWTELANYLGGFGAAGGKLKEVSYTHWFNPNTSATNESGFTALPGGYRFEHGSFCCLGGNGGWWSSTNYGTTSSWWIGLSYSYEWVDRNYYFNSGGYSIRCISDY